MAANGWIPLRPPNCCNATPFRRCRSRRRPRQTPLQRLPHRSCRRAKRWSSKSTPETSCTNPRSTASGSISPATQPSAMPRQAIISKRQKNFAAGAHRRRHRPTDDHQTQGARADCRHRGRRDLRAGDRVRPRRHRRRSHQRQGTVAAAARPQPGARPDRAHARVTHPGRLSERAGGKARRGRAHAREARTAGGRPAGGP